MTAYRQHDRRSTDLETDALHDLLGRMKRLRRRVALPVLISASIAAWIGATAHCIGYWPVFGTSSDGTYLVSAFTILIAAALCAAPIVAPGIVVYVLRRARLRRSWRDEHRGNGVDDKWLVSNSHRFG